MKPGINEPNSHARHAYIPVDPAVKSISAPGISGVKVQNPYPFHNALLDVNGFPEFENLIDLTISSFLSSKKSGQE